MSKQNEEEKEKILKIFSNGKFQKIKSQKTYITKNIDIRLNKKQRVIVYKKNKKDVSDIIVGRKYSATF